MSLAEIAKAGEVKILTLDIETFPSVVYAWGRFDQNIGLNQVVSDGSVACFAGKWYGDKKVHFYSDHANGHAGMVNAAWDMLNEADIVVGFNHRAFDIKHLHREFQLAGFGPPSPHRDIDLLTVARQSAKWESNKLDNVSNRLGIGQKIKHEGFTLWRDCMAGDAAAWKRMERYNRGDVVLTERLYDRLRPWIKGHPHIGLWTGAERSCANCGSENLTADGRSVTPLTAYARYVCDDCGAWSRMNHRKTTVTMRGAR
jgi:hypothetical protein